MGVDLYKVTEDKQLFVNLMKEKNIEYLKARVVLVLDFSYSMDNLYKSKDKTMQRTVEKILPVGLSMDDNGEVDTYIFHSAFNRVKALLTMSNIVDYVDKNILSQFEYGSTKYAPVINDIVKRFGNESTGGFLGIGAKTKPAEQPTFVIFITDGNNDYDDKDPARKAIIEAANHAIFFQFIGIGSASFPFLEELDDMEGRLVDNADFAKVPDLKTASTESIYKIFLNEFAGWLGKAKTAGLLR